MSKLLRTCRFIVGSLVLLAALWWIFTIAPWSAVVSAFSALAASGWLLAVALTAYAAAFAIRAGAWRLLQPQVGFGQAFAAIHIGLAGNHVLPARLGEVFRVTSATRRTVANLRETSLTTVVLRLGDLLALLAVAAIATPTILLAIMHPAVVVLLGVMLITAMGFAWRQNQSSITPVTSPKTFVAVAFATTTAWVLEASVLYVVAQAVGLPLSFLAAVGVTACTIFAQVLAVTPGGFGTYEAVGTAALMVLGVTAPQAFAVVFATHAVKTGYAVATGAVALVVPTPSYWGRFRLPAQLPKRPAVIPVSADSPVVVFLPAYNEADVIGAVIDRIPEQVHGRPVRILVIDDGSTDRTAAMARAAGATVLAQPSNLGLGAAVRRGLREAAALTPAAGVYLDADGEYRPEDIAAVVAPVLSGEVDYCIGSRFRGQIDHMHSHRRFGNLTLTRWVRWLTRRPDLTDGQSGFRTFSPAALEAAEVIHDYNYAQVLTLDLLAKGFTYGEVPIRYAFRTTGSSFISLGTYLRKVVPAVHRELNSPARSLKHPAEPVNSGP